MTPLPPNISELLACMASGMGILFFHASLSTVTRWQALNAANTRTLPSRSRGSMVSSPRQRNTAPQDQGTSPGESAGRPKLGVSRGLLLGPPLEEKGSRAAGDACWGALAETFVA